MPRTISLIQSARIASPCDMKWEDMTGDDRMRHCNQCNLNVYNFREMTEAEANKLLESATGRVCGQLYRRKDGTIMTKNCPVGLTAVRRKIYMGIARIAAAVVVVFTAFAYGRSRGDDNAAHNLNTYRTTTNRISNWLNGPPPQMALPGKIAVDRGEIMVVPDAGEE